MKLSICESRKRRRIYMPLPYPSQGMSSIHWCASSSCRVRIFLGKPADLPERHLLMPCPAQPESILNGWLYRGRGITVRCISLSVLMVWGLFPQILREYTAVANTRRKSRLAPGDLISNEEILFNARSMRRSCPARFPSSAREAMWSVCLCALARAIPRHSMSTLTGRTYSPIQAKRFKKQ